MEQEARDGLRHSIETAVLNLKLAKVMLAADVLTRCRDHLENAARICDEVWEGLVELEPYLRKS